MVIAGMNGPDMDPSPESETVVLRVHTAGERVFGRYRLVRQLGRGGMGVVWLCHDDELDQDIALKFLPELLANDRAAVDDLRRETRRSRELTHPHIMRVHDFLRDDNTAAIAMEFVDGDTLSNLRLAQPTRVFEPAQLTTWVEQLADALDFAHGKARVVHRDLKPANLMVNMRGDLKVADFGISATVSETVTRVSHAVSASGTPVYMSPQQMRGASPSPSDDIYSLGATLFELLTGKPPFFRGDVGMQVINEVAPTIAQRRAEFELPAVDVPPVWEEVIAACLAKDPSRRPPNAQTVAVALRTGTLRPIVVDSHLSGSPPVVGGLLPASAPRKSRVGLFAAITAAVIGVGACAFYLGVHFSRPKPADPEPPRVTQADPETPPSDPAAGEPALVPPAASEDPTPLPAEPTDPIGEPAEEQPVLTGPDTPPSAEAPLEITEEPPELYQPDTETPEEPEPPPPSFETEKPPPVAAADPPGPDPVLTPPAPVTEPPVRITLERPPIQTPAVPDPAPPAPVEQAVVPTPEPVPVASLRGSITIESTPPGAEMILGGFAYDRTPASFGDLQLGSYSLVIRMPGYQEWSREVLIQEGRNTQVRATLMRLAGTLQVNSVPSGLPFVVTGQGRTERGRTPATLTDLPPGAYTAVVTAENWPEQRLPVNVEAQQSAAVLAEFVEGTLSFSSEPAGASVRVTGGPLQAATFTTETGQESVTPFVGRLQPGDYELVFSLDGHEDVTERVTVNARQVVPLTVRLPKIERQTPPASFDLPDLRLQMVWIAPGSFTMGSPDTEALRDKDEGPLTEVTLSRGYWLGRHEVTVAQWQAVMGGSLVRARAASPTLPQQEVSWDDAMAFCRRLTERERTAGRLPAGHVYTLPTEAQWEFACRAGSSGPYAGSGSLDDMAWFASNSKATAHPVGTKRANAWGLHDMHGNVAEWCLDRYINRLPGGAVTDPTGPIGGAMRVVRGGGWNSYALFCRSADRLGFAVGERKPGLGFRVALSPEL